MITKNDDTSWHCCFYKLAYCVACKSQSLFYLAVVFNFLLVVGYVFVKCSIARTVRLAFLLAFIGLLSRLLHSSVCKLAARGYIQHNLQQQLLSTRVQLEV